MGEIRRFRSILMSSILVTAIMVKAILKGANSPDPFDTIEIFLREMEMALDD